jgi:hypothetical protein
MIERFLSILNRALALPLASTAGMRGSFYLVLCRLEV